MRNNGFPSELLVPEAVRRLYVAALPNELNDLIPVLAQMVCDNEAVADLVSLRWGDLSESQENLLAHAVGLAARELIVAIRSLAETGWRP